ncbi:hypothetical protein QBC40DRAFT_328977 [Triangularia verruculosa]|uniref:Uncharacterized protein n=1 Tax=Triangularia verruculosa TaxID=2587418 RepID=A0AAN7AX62_9PEZI|nr:hypothetical protein QBC40DRAFT_328977 [Triangularia verruculosa]
MAPPIWLAMRDVIKMGSATSAAATGEERGAPYAEPLVGMVISVILAMVSLVIISAFLTQRFLAVKLWSRLPFVQWLVFAIYTDSFLFVFAACILQFGFGVGYSVSVCESTILLCLTCYVTTKVCFASLIYMFLVEKAFIIRSGSKRSRLTSKLYLFNSFGMIGIYCVVVVMNFIYRITRVENGQCIIGMKREAMIPLISFDLLVNIYLTVIFLIPLTRTYTWKHFVHTQGSRRLRTVAMRTFVGCVCTLASSVANLSVLMALDGEPGWVCLMCCNSDILFSAIVIQWVTSRDSTSSAASTDSVSDGVSRPRSQNNNHTSLGGEELTGINSSRRYSSGDNRHKDPLDEDKKQQPRNKSLGARNLVSSTDAIVTDAAEMSVDHAEFGGDGDVSPRSTENNTVCYDDRDRETARRPHTSGSLTRSTTTTTRDDLPRPPPPVATSTVRHHTSEVRVDVDYGATSLSSREIADGEEARLGNSIVIGSGTSVSGVTDVTGGRWTKQPPAWSPAGTGPGL